MIKAKLSSFKCHIKAYLQSYITQFTYKNGNLQNTKYRKTEGIWKEKNTHTYTQKNHKSEHDDDWVNEKN